MKPEEFAELKLWEWLMTKGTNVSEVYLNRKNELNGVFSVKGTHGKKPDMLVKFDRGFGTEWIAVEVKSSDKSKDVYDACKILDYYEDYYNGVAKYFIGKEEIKISHFAIATDKSPKGFLLRKEKDYLDNLNDPDDDSNSEYKKYMVENNLFPRYEYYTTAVYLRLLWANWRRLKKRLNFDKAPSIGILINDAKEKDKPYFFTMVFCDWGMNKKWGQRYWRL